MRIMSVFTSFGGLEKTGGFAQTIVMSNNPKVDDPCAAGALAGVVSAFAEPSSWRVGTVLNVAWCAVCVSAAPNNWRIEDVLVVAGVV